MSQRTATARRAPRTGAAIVSSSHLVSPRSRELSELEFGLIVAWNAFSRWAVRCMAAAGCPDLTITDAAKLFGPALVLVVLTGMGKDGLEGARAVKAAGGRVLAEAESTCVVYGMPRAVAEAGLADEVLPLHDLPAAIAREAGA